MIRTGFSVAILGVAMLQAAYAQDERGRTRTSAVSPPIPVSRPSNLPAPAEPAKTAAPPATPAPARKTVAVLAPPPHDLPVATRARMHACGAEWQRMKMSGEAADKIWRVFAQSCLVGQP